MAKPTEEIILNEEKPLDARRIACHVREIIKLIGEDQAVLNDDFTES